MRARIWMIGFTLGMAGIGTAAASLATQDLGAAEHSQADGGSSRSSRSGGDALGISHDSSAHASHADHTDSSPDTNSEHAAGGPLPSAPARQPHLGWQSLLPGSIQ